PFRHERDRRLAYLANIIPRNDGFLPFFVHDHERLWRRVLYEPGQHAVVLERDDEMGVFRADRGAGVDDVLHQHVNVAALGAGQPGTDGSAFAEKRVAPAAARSEDLLTLDAVVAPPGSVEQFRRPDNAGEFAGLLSFFLIAGLNTTPCLFNERCKLGVL